MKSKHKINCQCCICKNKRGESSGKNCPNFIDGRSIKKYFCKDCNKEISWVTAINGQGRCQSCSKLGKRNSNFQNARPRCINCGKEISWTMTRCRECYKLSVIGQNNYNYKGTTVIYDLIRKLSLYLTWRLDIFKRDNYTCQECNIRGGHLHAHHDKIKFSELLKEFLQEYNQFSPIEDKETLIRLAINWKPFWDLSNGKTICENCHKEKHTNLNFKK